VRQNSRSLLVLGLLSESSETVNGGLGGHGGSGGEHPGASSNLFVSGLAFPDSDSGSSNALLLGKWV